jgi:hypothetical protein
MIVTMQRYRDHLVAASVALTVFLAQAAWAQSVPAPGANPGEAEVEAVLGPETPVKRTAPAQYQIDGETVTLADLLKTRLPEKEASLKAIQENLYQRFSTQQQVASGLSIETKRAQCQALPQNSIDRTRCYQELVALREQQAQAAQATADERDEEEAQMEKLQQQIEAIDTFRNQYGAK